MLPAVASEGPDERRMIFVDERRKVVRRRSDRAEVDAQDGGRIRVLRKAIEVVRGRAHVGVPALCDVERVGGGIEGQRIRGVAFLGARQSAHEVLFDPNRTGTRQPRDHARVRVQIGDRSVVATTDARVARHCVDDRTR